jgi:hypothetical protein
MVSRTASQPWATRKRKKSFIPMKMLRFKVMRKRPKLKSSRQMKMWSKRRMMVISKGKKLMMSLKRKREICKRWRESRQAKRCSSKGRMTQIAMLLLSKASRTTNQWTQA